MFALFLCPQAILLSHAVDHGSILCHETLSQNIMAAAQQRQQSGKPGGPGSGLGIKRVILAFFLIFITVCDHFHIASVCSLLGGDLSHHFFPLLAIHIGKNFLTQNLDQRALLCRTLARSEVSTLQCQQRHILHTLGHGHRIIRIQLIPEGLPSVPLAVAPEPVDQTALFRPHGCRLLAHELSHSLQQGVGGMGGMQQSAPMGTEQGGLIDWFRSRKKAAKQGRIENYLKSLPMDQQVEALSIIAQGKLYDENGAMDESMLGAYQNVANSYADMTDENAGAFAEELARQQGDATMAMESFHDSALLGEGRLSGIAWSDRTGYGGYGASRGYSEADYMTQHSAYGRQVRAYDELFRTARAMQGVNNSPLFKAVSNWQKEQMGENYTMVDSAIDQMNLQSNEWADANRTAAEKMVDRSNREGWQAYKAWEKKHKQGWAPPKKHFFRRWLNR